MLKLPKPIKRTPPRAESDADRAVYAVTTDAELLGIKQLVANMGTRKDSKPGTYTDSGEIKEIRAVDARQYWGV